MLGLAVTYVLHESYVILRLDFACFSFDCDHCRVFAKLFSLLGCKRHLLNSFGNERPDLHPDLQACRTVFCPATY